MEYSRRSFLKIGCLSAVTLASMSIFGCSSQQSTGNTSGSSQAQTEGESQMSSTTSNASSASTSNASANAAVVYFSCTGNTEAVAEKIALATDGTLMRIEPAEPYTSADLDYNSDCRANTEQNSNTARPAIAAPVPDVAGYDTVYIGYPIWWGKAPRIILTFLDDANLAGKTVIPFCTSGSSPISGSIAEIHEAAPDATWLDGKRFSASTSQQEIDSWVASL